MIAFGVYLLVKLPATYTEASRYQDAERCPGKGAEPPRCLEVIDGRIERVFSRPGGRGRDLHLAVRVGEGATFPPARQPKEVEIEDTTGRREDEASDEAVYDQLEEGDRVELGYWGRQLARVTKPGVGSVETIASPAFDSGIGLTLGPLLPLLGGLGWWGALALRRRSGTWQGKASFGTPPRSISKGLGVGAVFGVTILALMIGDGVGTDVGLVVFIWVFGALGGAALFGVLALLVALARRLRE